MLFCNMLASFSDEKRTNYEHCEYRTDMSFIKTEQGTNHRKLLTINGSVDKTFSQSGLSAKLEMGYTLHSYLLSQETALTHNHSNIFSAGIRLDYQKLEWFRFFSEIGGNLHWERNQVYDSEKLKTLQVNATCYLFPNKKWTIKTIWQYGANEVSKSYYKSYVFLDSDLSYKWGKSLKLGIMAYNLLDTKSFVNTENSGFNKYYYELPLRSREVLFKAIFRF